MDTNNTHVDRLQADRERWLEHINHLSVEQWTVQPNYKREEKKSFYAFVMPIPRWRLSKCPKIYYWKECTASVDRCDSSIKADWRMLDNFDDGHFSSIYMLLGICMDIVCRIVAFIIMLTSTMHSFGCVLFLHQQHLILDSTYRTTQRNVTCGHDTCNKYYADE